MSESKLRIELPNNIQFEYSGPANYCAEEREAFLDAIAKLPRATQNEKDDQVDAIVYAAEGAYNLRQNTYHESDADLFKDIAGGRVKLKVGDVITCTLTDGREVSFDVTDEDTEGYRLELQELLDRMPHDDVESWYSDVMIDLLPEEIREAIIPTVRKYRVNGDGELKEKTCKLFMPSASEVFPEDCCYGDAGVYEQLEFYKLPRNRVKHLLLEDPEDDDNGEINYWWLLSAYAGISTYFAYVNYYGYANASNATNTWIAAPVCFRIRKN